MVEAAVVVVLAWITMVLLLFRIEPEFRHRAGKILSPWRARLGRSGTTGP